MPLRFVAPSPADPYYEVHLYETGCVATRTENWHDLFNALVWLAYPRTKAVINALHARQIPLEGGRRGRLRDLLTIFEYPGWLPESASADFYRDERYFRPFREKIRTGGNE
jgi:hypothetical protein